MKALITKISNGRRQAHEQVGANISIGNFSVGFKFKAKKFLSETYSGGGCSG